MKIPSPILPAGPSQRNTTVNHAQARPNPSPNNDPYISSFHTFSLETKPSFLPHNSGSLRRMRRRSYHTSSSWDPHDDLLLRHLKEQQKLSWKDISNYFPNRTVNACQFRWRRLTSGAVPNSDIYEVHCPTEAPSQPLDLHSTSSQGWTPEEDHLLFQCKDLNFSQLSKLFPHKTDHEIKSRILILASNKYSSSNSRPQYFYNPHDPMVNKNSSLLNMKSTSTLPAFSTSSSTSPSSIHFPPYFTAAPPVRHTPSLPTSVSTLPSSPSSLSPSPRYGNGSSVTTRSSLSTSDELPLSSTLIPDQVPTNIQSIAPLNFRKLSPIPPSSVHSTAIRSGLNSQSTVLPSFLPPSKEYNAGKYTSGLPSHDANFIYGDPLYVQENSSRKNSVHSPNGSFNHNIFSSSNTSLSSFQTSAPFSSSFLPSSFVTTPFATASTSAPILPSYFPKSTTTNVNANANTNLSMKTSPPGSYFPTYQFITRNPSSSAFGLRFSSRQKLNENELSPILLPPTPSASETRRSSFINSTNKYSLKLPVPLSSRIITATDYNVSNYTAFVNTE